MKLFVAVLACLCLSPLPVSAQPGPAKPGSNARVALVSNQSQQGVKNVLDLAQAQLSADKNLVLPERAGIERILDEQKLSLSGLADASTAIAVGKLLSVELF